MFRRSFLLGSSALSLSACGLLKGTSAVQTVTTDARLILDGLQAALSKVGGLVPGHVVDVVGNAIASAQQFLSAVSGATTDAAKPLVQQLIAALQAGLPSLMSMLLPPPLGIVINAVLTLLPALAAEIGLLTSPQAIPTGMSFGQARAVLQTP